MARRESEQFHKVKLTGLAQNSQVNPAVLLKIPIKALELTQILVNPVNFRFDTKDSVDDTGSTAVEGQSHMYAGRVRNIWSGSSRRGHNTYFQYNYIGIDNKLASMSPGRKFSMYITFHLTLGRPQGILPHAARLGSRTGGGHVEDHEQVGVLAAATG